MRAIVFDLDDTLYDLMDPFEKTHKELLENETDAPCTSLFMASRIYSDEAFYMVEEGKLAPEDAFAYRIMKTYEEAGVALSREDTRRFEERYRYYQQHIQVPEKIAQMLDFCKENQITIGILTNGTANNQGKKLKKLEITRWFCQERIFISGEIGYTKPDPKAFEQVALAMDLEPEDTWYVGDTFEVDVEGAKRAGWHVVWFNHRKRPQPEGDTCPDAEVRTVEELKNFIENLL